MKLRRRKKIMGLNIKIRRKKIDPKVTTQIIYDFYVAKVYLDIIISSPRFMLGGPSEKKNIFFSGSPPSKSSFRYPETYNEIHGKKDKQGKNPRPVFKWNMIISHLAQLFFPSSESPPKSPHMGSLLPRPSWKFKKLMSCHDRASELFGNIMM